MLAHTQPNIAFLWLLGNPWLMEPPTWFADKHLVPKKETQESFHLSLSQGLGLPQDTAALKKDPSEFSAVSISWWGNFPEPWMWFYHLLPEPSCWPRVLHPCFGEVWDSGCVCPSSSQSSPYPPRSSCYSLLGPFLQLWSLGIFRIL